MEIGKIKIIDLIEKENTFFGSMRTLNVLYRILIIKVKEPILDDIVTYYDFIKSKTSKMKKTFEDIDMTYNYLLKF